MISVTDVPRNVDSTHCNWLHRTNATFKTECNIGQYLTKHTIEDTNCRHTLLFSSDFWILCAFESINQSINQSKYIQLKAPIATTLCYFPVTSGFGVLLDQSINQSINQSSTLCCSPVTSGFLCYWIINQSIDQSLIFYKIRVKIHTSTKSNFKFWKNEDLTLEILKDVCKVEENIAEIFKKWNITLDD